MKLFAGIVTFNPDMDVFVKNIDAIIKQVSYVAIFDNNSSNIDNIRDYIKKYTSIELIESNENLGIAFALNELMKNGEKKKFDFMLSLDQDSICPPDYVDKMLSELKKIDNIGVFAPTIVDRNVGVIGYNFSEEFRDVRNAITSGAIISIDCWKTIGGYDNNMFIDSVDFDFCYRARKNGYKVVQTSKVLLNHAIGEGTIKRFLIFKIRNNEHSAFRCFYMAQNRIYYPRKNRDFLLLIKGNFKNIIHLFTVLFFEKDKKNKVKSIFSGWINGYRLKWR